MVIFYFFLFLFYVKLQELKNHESSYNCKKVELLIHHYACTPLKNSVIRRGNRFTGLWLWYSYSGSRINPPYCLISFVALIYNFHFTSFILLTVIWSLFYHHFLGFHTWIVTSSICLNPLPNYILWYDFWSLNLIWCQDFCSLFVPLYSNWCLKW